jgi:hypothetical protein
MVEAQVTALTAKQGDTCVREVPRLLTKEEIRSLSEIDSGKAMLAFAVEILFVAAAVGPRRPVCVTRVTDRRPKAGGSQCDHGLGSVRSSSMPGSGLLVPILRSVVAALLQFGP